MKSEPLLIEMSGFSVTLLRKKIKRLNVRIHHTGEVRVSAPTWMRLEVVHAFLAAKRAWIETHRARLQKGRRDDTAKDVLLNRHPQMQQLLPALFAKWEALIGVKAECVQIKIMKSRWGSCHPLKKKVTLNLRLIEKPLLCLEYVIVHELVHMLEVGHNQRFYALMNQFMPEWKMAKDLLNQSS